MRGAQLNRPCVCVLSEDESARVKAFVVRMGGVRVAQLALGVSRDTLNAARDYGRMQRTTRDRLVAALEREEGITP